MSLPANFPAVQVGWAGYSDPATDEHAEALGEFPRMPEIPARDETDSAASRIHAKGQPGLPAIEIFGPSLWQRFKAWWQS